MCQTTALIRSEENGKGWQAYEVGAGKYRAMNFAAEEFGD